MSPGVSLGSQGFLERWEGGALESGLTSNPWGCWVPAWGSLHQPHLPCGCGRRVGSEGGKQMSSHGTAPYAQLVIQVGKILFSESAFTQSSFYRNAHSSPHILHTAPRGCTSPGRALEHSQPTPSVVTVLPRQTHKRCQRCWAGGGGLGCRYSRRSLPTGLVEGVPAPCRAVSLSPPPAPPQVNRIVCGGEGGSWGYRDGYTSARQSR